MHPRAAARWCCAPPLPAAVGAERLAVERHAGRGAERRAAQRERAGATGAVGVAGVDADADPGRRRLTRNARCVPSAGARPRLRARCLRGWSCPGELAPGPNMRLRRISPYSSGRAASDGRPWSGVLSASTRVWMSTPSAPAHIRPSSAFGAHSALAKALLTPARPPHDAELASVTRSGRPRPCALAASWSTLLVETGEARAGDERAQRGRRCAGGQWVSVDGHHAELGPAVCRQVGPPGAAWERRGRPGDPGLWHDLAHGGGVGGEVMRVVDRRVAERPRRIVGARPPEPEHAAGVQVRLVADLKPGEVTLRQGGEDVVRLLGGHRRGADRQVQVEQDAQRHGAGETAESVKPGLIERVSAGPARPGCCQLLSALWPPIRSATAPVPGEARIARKRGNAGYASTARDHWFPSTVR